MLRSCVRHVPRLASRPQWRRFQSTRADGFNEALPRRDLVAPAFFAGVFGFSWWAAEEGTIKGLAEKMDMPTDPNAYPTPNQIFHQLWPFLAGTLGMLFE